MSRALVLCGLISAGCASGPQVRTQSEGDAVAKDVADVPVRGFDTKVVSVGPVPTVTGELLAVDEAHVWVMSESRVVGVHRAGLQETLVTLEGLGGGGAAAWTALGTLSAISHGFVGVFSGPIWLVVGVPTAAVMASTNTASFKGAATGTLWQFARFPQGLPAAWRNCAEHEAPKPTVTETDVVAPEVRGAAPIVRLEEEPRCSGRGARILSGIDTNKNGFLEVPAEVLKETSVCRGDQQCTALEGSLTIHTSLEWERLVQTGCSTISGDLLIEAPGLLRLSPDALALTTVTGAVSARNNAALAELSLPALTTATRVDIAGNAALASLSLPKLEVVNGGLTVSDNAALKTLSFPSLKVVSGSVKVSNDEALMSASFEALESVSENLFVSNDPELTTLSLPALKRLDGMLTITRNAKLRQCLVDALMKGLATHRINRTASENGGMPNTCP